MVHPDPEKLRKRRFFSISLLVLAPTSANAKQPVSAGLVILRGLVWAVDRAHPQAEKDAAVRYTVVGEKIVYEEGKN